MKFICTLLLTLVMAAAVCGAATARDSHSRTPTDATKAAPRAGSANDEGEV